MKLVVALELELDVEVEVTPGEAPTRSHPGTEPSAELISAEFCGVDLMPLLKRKEKYALELAAEEKVRDEELERECGRADRLHDQMKDRKLEGA